MKRITLLSLVAFLVILIGCAEKMPTTPTPLVPDTVTVNDTVMQIITRIDTVFVPVYDTTFLPGDTIWQWHYDTVVVYDTTVVYDSTVIYDTVTVIDSVFVPYVVHDTVLVYLTDTLYFPPDTVIVVDTLVDTIYVPIGTLVDTACWQIDYNQCSQSVQLDNPAGWYLVGFDWFRSIPPPNGKGYYVRAGEEEFGFAVTGKPYQVSWVGSEHGVYLEANATLTIRFGDLRYTSGLSVASPDCVYLDGCHWWLVPMRQ